MWDKESDGPPLPIHVNPQISVSGEFWIERATICSGEPLQDGKLEILVATSGGLIVALDATCQKVWAHRLAEPPVVMKCVNSKPRSRPWIVVGCEDGTVTVLDRNGSPIRQRRLNGAPTQIAATVDRTGIPLVVFSTDKGEIKWFAGLYKREECNTIDRIILYIVILHYTKSTCRKSGGAGPIDG